MPVVTYHGRTGKPKIHSTTGGRKYIMVRKRGGGTKRLYEGSQYYTNPTRKRGKRKYRRLSL